MVAAVVARAVAVATGAGAAVAYTAERRRRELSEQAGREARLAAQVAETGEQGQRHSRLLAFWAGAEAQVTAARRLQCWLRGRLLSVRLDSRRRPVPARQCETKGAAGRDPGRSMAGR